MWFHGKGNQASTVMGRSVTLRSAPSISVRNRSAYSAVKTKGASTFSTLASGPVIEMIREFLVPYHVERGWGSGHGDDVTAKGVEVARVKAETLNQSRRTAMPATGYPLPIGLPMVMISGVMLCL
jgi:hypothetical protein